MTSTLSTSHLSEIVRKTHKEKRAREYLYEHEVEALITAAKNTTQALRNQTLILLCYRHGLRPTEACNLRWSQIDLENHRIHVTRIKGGEDSVQPLRDREIRLLRRMWKEKKGNPEFIFMTRHGTKFNQLIFHKLMCKLGIEAGLLIPKIHPHMLRHSTGYKLANDGVDLRVIQDYLGHKNINNTVLYTKLSEKKFDKIFRD